MLPHVSLADEERKEVGGEICESNRRLADEGEVSNSASRACAEPSVLERFIKGGKLHEDLVWPKPRGRGYGSSMTGSASKGRKAFREGLA